MSLSVDTGAGAFAGLADVDGMLVPLADAVVPATDRGFLLGDAVYETLRTYGGRLFALADHLDRLEASMQRVDLRGAPERKIIVERLVRLARKTASALADLGGHAGESGGPDLVVRVTVTRGSGPHGFGIRESGPPRVVMMARPLPRAPPSVYDKGLSVVTAHRRRVPPAVLDPRIKAASALHLVLARAEAEAAGADDALLRDLDGDYLESAGANLVLIQGDRYVSPLGSDGVLEGVTARRVFALLDTLGLSGDRRPIKAVELRQADEVWLTQTTREILPVVYIDGEPIGGGRPGPLAGRVRRLFRERVERELDREA